AAHYAFDIQRCAGRGYPPGLAGAERKVEKDLVGGRCHGAIQTDPAALQSQRAAADRIFLVAGEPDRLNSQIDQVVVAQKALCASGKGQSRIGITARDSPRPVAGHGPKTVSHSGPRVCRGRQTVFKGLKPRSAPWPASDRRSPDAWDQVTGKS